MLNQIKPKDIRTSIAKTQFSLKKIWREIWPINWSNFKKPKLILVSLVEAPYIIKTTFLISLIASIVSVGFFFFGTYLAFTKEVPDNGGEIREALYENDLKNFNPVLEPISEGERKITSLLYLPLYKVEVPDFLNTPNKNPEVTPVLLSQAPQWQDLDQPVENKYRVLRFDLRNDVYWSNNTPITVNDVEYTFERLKENKANLQFRNVFSRVEFAKISQTQFDLRSPSPNPQLLYLANFSPISKDYYANQNTERLSTSFNSAKPTVTSGYFTFNNDLVRDPDFPESTPRDNPIRVDGQDGFTTVVLTKNPVQNTKEKINLDRYIFKNYTNLYDSGGSTKSIERVAKDQRLDIFTRQLSTSTTPFSQDIKDKTGLEQKIISTNNYFNIYFNVRRNDVFINQMIRKYVACSLASYQLNTLAYPGIEEIPSKDRIVPIQLGIDNTPAGTCPANPKDILDGKTYKYEEDTKTGVKKVLTCARRCTDLPKLTLIGFEESDPLLTDIQTFLRDIGVPANLVKDPVEVNRRLESKEYSIAFLPVSLNTRDPYPVFGGRGRDISQIKLNNSKSILEDNIEDAFSRYSISNTTDSEAKAKLINFFNREFISLNMFRSKIEINYSKRISGIEDSLAHFGDFNFTYYNVSRWYEKLKREFK